MLPRARVPRGCDHRSALHYTTGRLRLAAPTRIETHTVASATSTTGDRTVTTTHYPQFKVVADEDGKYIPRCPYLDDASDPDPALEHLLTQALDSIALRMDGPTSSLTQRIKGSGPGSRAPVSSTWTDAKRVRRDFDMARTRRQRLAAVQEAQELGTTTRTPDPEKVQGTPEWLEAIARDPRVSRAIAADWPNLSYSTVGRIKRAAKKLGSQVAKPATLVHDSHTAESHNG